MIQFSVGDRVRADIACLHRCAVEVKYISADVCVVACDDWNGTYREISLHPNRLRPLDWTHEEPQA